MNILINRSTNRSQPSNYVTVTVMLTGSTFDLAKQIKGAARQRYGDRDVIARCEQTFSLTAKSVKLKLRRLHIQSQKEIKEKQTKTTGCSLCKNMFS